jgi:hypothetical protein
VLERLHAEARTERGTCRFVAAEGQGGKPVIRVELFHGTVSVRTHATLNFNLRDALSLEKAKKMAEIISDSILDPSPCQRPPYVCEIGEVSQLSVRKRNSLSVLGRRWTVPADGCRV